MTSTERIRFAALISGALLVILAPAAQASVTVKPLLTLNGTNVPESITIDHAGDMYLSAPLSDKIFFVAPNRSPRVFATFSSGNVLGVRLNDRGDLFAAVAGLGIFEFPAGTTTPVERVAMARFWNGMAFDHRGNLYVTDSATGEIWRLTRDFSFSKWVATPLLVGTTGPGPCRKVHPAVAAGFGAIGANGNFFNKHGDMLVSNTDLGTVVRIPMNPDGTAGTPTVFASDCTNLWGADGGAMDNEDNLYVAANSSDRIAIVHPDGSVGLFTDSSLLHFPTDIAFGTGRGDRKVAYITNLALTSNFTNGGVVTMEVGIPGRPTP